jgi:hypothetical protein
MPEPVDAGRWRVQTREFDPAKYSTAVVSGPTFTDTSLPSPTTPPTLGPLTLTEEYVVQPTGAMPLSRIRATFAAVTTWPFVAGYRFIVKDINGVVVSDQSVTGNVYVSPPLPALTSYTVSGYVLSRVAQSATASTAAISLVGTGVESLATVASAAITPSGGWFIDGPEQYQLYPGDANMRLRMDFSTDMASVYTGSDMSTPGRASMLLDALKSAPIGTSIYSWSVTSPTYDLGAERTGVIAILNVQDWAALYAAGMTCTIYARNAANTITSTTTGYRALVTSARYVYFRIDSISEKAGPTTRYYYNWAIEFVNASLAMMMPTVTDNVPASSSASGSVTVQLPRRYISITSVQVTAQSATQANPSYSNVLTSESTLSGNTLQLDVYDQTNARLAVPCSITVTGVAA